MFKIFEEKEDTIINKQKCYGQYCNKCRQKNINPMPFSEFTIEFWNSFRKN